MFFGLISSTPLEICQRVQWRRTNANSIVPLSGTGLFGHVRREGIASFTTNIVQLDFLSQISNGVNWKREHKLKSALILADFNCSGKSFFLYFIAPLTSFINSEGV